MADNPYVGPRSIKTGEAFWGRDREIRSLSALLLAERIVLLHSPSGAGKSSLIEAGLRPRMEERFKISPLVRVNLEIPDELRGVAGLNRYLISTLLSLEEAVLLEKRLPLTELTTISLDAYLEKRALPDDANSLLLFDQFEEVLTVSPTDAPAKQQFFEQLGEALQNRRRWALFAIREDYMGGLAPYVRAIPNRLNVTFRLGLLGVQAAKLAIQQPAKDKGVDFTDAAAQKLVDDLCLMQVQQPDGSFKGQTGLDVEPVQLQVVCYNLWQLPRADEKSISEDDVQRVGSVDQALASFYAERLRDISEKNQLDERILRQWFNDHLITAEGIRSQVLKGIQSTAELPNAILSQLESAYLIRGETRAGKTWYELSHDRLVQPIRRDNTTWFEQNLSIFQRRAELWNQQGRSEGLLLRDKEFMDAEKEVGSLQLPSDENAFLDACRKLQKHEQQDIRQKRFIVIGLLTSLIFLVLALWGFIYANQQNQQALAYANQAGDAQKTSAINENLAKAAQVAAEAAEKKALEQAKIARAGELASYAVGTRVEDFQLSLLLSIEAFRSADTYQSRNVLLDNTQTNSWLRKFLSIYEPTVKSIAFSPDHKTVAFSSTENTTIILWNVETNQPIGEPLKAHTAVVSSLTFNILDGGKTLAAGDQNGTVILWNVMTHKPIAQPLKGHIWGIYDVDFNPDGKTLISISKDATVIWDIASHQPRGQPLKEDFDLISKTFSPDGKTLAFLSSDAIILWDMVTHQPIGQPLMGTFELTSIAFSPNSKILASGSCAKKIVTRKVHGNEITECSQGEVILWNVATGQQIGQPLRGHTHVVQRIVFNPDGETLVSGAADNTMILWDVLTHRIIRELLDETKDVFDPDLNPEEIERVSVYREGKTIVLRDSTIMQPIGRGRLLKAHNDWVSSMAFSPDGKILATGSVDETMLLWDVSTLLNTSVISPQPIGQQIQAPSSVWSVAFSPNGMTLASLSLTTDTNVDLWDVSTVLNSNMATPQPIAQLSGDSYATTVAFSPDGKLLAAESSDKTITLWNVATNEPIGKPLKGHDSDVLTVVFSPNSKLLASGSSDRNIILWDMATHEPIGQPLKGHDSDVFTVAFSLDGKLLASGSSDNTIMVWNVATHEPIGLPLKGHTGPVRSLAFSPLDGGKTLVSGSEDGTIILWDVATYQPIGQPLTSNPKVGIRSVTFSPDGKTFVSGNENGTIILWDLDPQTWATKSCERVGRNLTHAEWAQYGFTETYRATCPQFGLEAEPTP